MELVRLKDSGFSFEVAFGTNDRDPMYFQSFGFASKSVGFFKQALYRVGAVCIAVEMAAAGEPAVRMVHDFGRLPPGGQWRHVFVFTNTLDHPLEIEAADKSCSCLEIEDWPRIIAAGKSGALAIRLHTVSARGPRSESVRLRTKGSDSSEWIFEISAFVQAPIEATPEFVSLKADPAAKTNAFAYVQITNHLAKNVILTNAISLTDRFAAKLEVIHPGRSYRLRIEAIPPFNSGNTFGTIQINTSLPEYPRLEVTALVPSKN